MHNRNLSYRKNEELRTSVMRLHQPHENNRIATGLKQRKYKVNEEQNFFETAAENEIKTAVQKQAHLQYMDAVLTISIPKFTVDRSYPYAEKENGQGGNRKCAVKNHAMTSDAQSIQLCKGTPIGRCALIPTEKIQP